MGEVVALASHPAREQRISVRLSADEADRLNRYAARHGVDRSNVIRLATSKFLAAEERSIADIVADLVGTREN